jgi:hypothetical protein
VCKIRNEEDQYKVEIMPHKGSWRDLGKKFSSCNKTKYMCSGKW